MSTEPGFDPVAKYLFLQDGGGAFSIDDPDALWQGLMGEGTPNEDARKVAESAGWLFSAYEFTEDMTSWEMHPQGNEALFLASGAMDVVFDEPGGERMVALTAGTACTVPPGCLAPAARARTRSSARCYLRPRDATPAAVSPAVEPIR